ncbi:hypothetical protein [Paenibacillus methanolicus]|uniref:Uncharacterized protein n=1 Tax=Paenibacillus methanolicus TaxID=582686 RepID=A0A5S5BXV0_9BACL|nr:hypothetical protein [Paenibacillus methanolicus]TYP71844.1 hypothetical protein BCM02_109122 [Paenibacillus methanolicus]
MTRTTAIRRPQTFITANGITMLTRHNPYVILWWSASFPGFGHFVLNMYLRGTLLSVGEVITNTLAHVNEAMVLSFCGQFEQAKAVIDPTWTYGYLMIYFWAMYDSYRSASEVNKLTRLAELENAPIRPFHISRWCLQYIEIKKPRVAAICSLIFPGLGQLYNHRLDLGFWGMMWWWIYIGKSHLYDGVLALINGNLRYSTAVLNPHWLLFMPSVLGGAIYHAHLQAGDHNRLFRLEQRQYMTNRYQEADIERIWKGE